MSKPTVLVLGGVGFLGRHFVAYLVENSLAEEIRVADKALPQTAYFDKRFKEVFSKVDFVQGNLVNPASIEKVFTRACGSSYDYVFNFAAETKYSQADEIYAEKIFLLSENCGKEAAKRKVKIFVEFSTAEVYDSCKEISKENSKLDPWTGIAKYKLKAEEALQKIDGLNLVILRPAVAYGTGALTGITPRLIIGRVYQHLKEQMVLLWSAELRLNTVHAIDVARATWHVAEWYVSNGKSGHGATRDELVFNLADKEDTNQETINKHIRAIFGIQTGFQGAVISNFAKLNLADVTDEINEKHLAPWAELLRNSRIKGSPLTPFLDQELLYNNALAVDGSKITRVTGFEYSVPILTTEKVAEVIDGFKAMNFWPKDA